MCIFLETVISEEKVSKLWNKSYKFGLIEKKQCFVQKLKGNSATLETRTLFFHSVIHRWSNNRDPLNGFPGFLSFVEHCSTKSSICRFSNVII